MRIRAIKSLLIVAAVVGCLVVSTVSVTALGSTTTVLDFGSSGWAYYRGAEQPAKNWTTTKAQWPRGTAPLGFGTESGTLGTTLKNDVTCAPPATYFQKSFSLDRAPSGGLTLTTWADDGVIIYVNGNEVLRHNLPAGAVRNTTTATTAVASKAARSHLVSASVPAWALDTGINLLSAQVQSADASSSVSFDARLEKRGLTAPSVPPGSPPAAAAGTASATDAAPDSSADLPGWGTPTWRDEFTHRDAVTNAPAIDPCKWNVRDRNDLGLLFDAAVPSAGQVSVDEAGIAHLRGDWLDQPVERPALQSGPRELWHKTAYMDQRAIKPGDVSYSQRYGRWEIRAKVPTGPDTLGALAAFWLRNEGSGEIDIMEAWGYHEQAAPGGQRIDTATTTVHTDSSGGGGQKYFWHHADYGAATPVWGAFHTYAFELTPNYAAIYVDGARIVKVTPATHPNLWNPKYFGTPLHVRLNLHVGPSAQYWGLPDPNHRDWTKPLDFQVDYVRIWNYDDRVPTVTGN